jgi:hypothetical protein
VVSFHPGKRHARLKSAKAFPHHRSPEPAPRQARFGGERGGDRRMMSNEAMKDIGHQRTRRRQSTPDWAGGLRRLYDSVVEEPLPDSFAQLLDKLDEKDD